MAGSITGAQVSVEFDSKGAPKVVSDFGMLGGVVDDAGKKSTSFWKTATASAAGFLGANLVANASQKVLELGKSFVMGASNQAEAQSLVDEVYKNSSGVVSEWANNAAKNFGLSKAAALQYAGAMGNLFTNMGFGTDVAAQMSTQMLSLAGDMGSAFNVEQAQAVDAMTSAFVGEYDSLQRLGVNINAAAVEQYALTHGLWDGTAAMTDQARAAAVQGIILEQTANIQGNYAKTSKGLANQTKTLSAMFANLGANIGKVLLPAAIKLTGWGITALNWLGKMGNPLDKVTRLFGGLGDVFRPITRFANSFLNSYRNLTDDIVKRTGYMGATITQGMSAVPAIFIALGNAIGGIGGGIPIFEAIGDVVMGFGGRLLTLLGIWNRLRGEGLDPVHAALTALTGAFPELQRVVTALTPMFENLLDSFNALRDGNYEQAFISLGMAAVSAFEGLSDLVVPLVNWTLDVAAPAIVAAGWDLVALITNYLTTDIIVPLTEWTAKLDGAKIVQGTLDLAGSISTWITEHPVETLVGAAALTIAFTGLPAVTILGLGAAIYLATHDGIPDEVLIAAGQLTIALIGFSVELVDLSAAIIVELVGEMQTLRSLIKTAWDLFWARTELSPVSIKSPAFSIDWSSFNPLKLVTAIAGPGSPIDNVISGVVNRIPGLGLKMVQGFTNMFGPGSPIDSGINAALSGIGDIVAAAAEPFVTSLGTTWDDITGAFEDWTWPDITIPDPDITWPDITFSITDIPFVSGLVSTLGNVGALFNSITWSLSVNAPTLSWPTLSIGINTIPFVMALVGLLGNVSSLFRGLKWALGIALPTITWPKVPGINDVPFFGDFISLIGDIAASISGQNWSITINLPSIAWPDVSGVLDKIPQWIQDFVSMNPFDFAKKYLGGGSSNSGPGASGLPGVIGAEGDHDPAKNTTTFNDDGTANPIPNQEPGGFKPDTQGWAQYVTAVAEATGAVSVFKGTAIEAFGGVKGAADANIVPVSAIFASVPFTWAAPVQAATGAIKGAFDANLPASAAVAASAGAQVSASMAGMSARSIGSVSGMAGSVRGQMGGMSSSASGTASGMSASVQGSARAMQGGVSSATSQMASAAIGNSQRAASGSVSAIAGATGGIRSAAGAWAGAVSGQSGSMREAGRSAGAAAGDGLVAGLRGAIGRVQGAAADLASAAAGAMSGALKQASPSKVTEKIGDYAVDGFLIPFERRLGEARNMASTLADAVAAGLGMGGPQVALSGPLGAGMGSYGTWALGGPGASAAVVEHHYHDNRTYHILDAKQWGEVLEATGTVQELNQNLERSHEIVLGRARR